MGEMFCIKGENGDVPHDQMPSQRHTRSIVKSGEVEKKVERGNQVEKICDATMKASFVSRKKYLLCSEKNA